MWAGMSRGSGGGDERYFGLLGSRSIGDGEVPKKSLASETGRGCAIPAPPPPGRDP